MPFFVNFNLLVAIFIVLIDIMIIAAGIQILQIYRCRFLPFVKALIGSLSQRLNTEEARRDLENMVSLK